MFRTLCILVALGCAVDVAAQSPPDLPKWDLAASTGVFVGHPADPPDSGSFDEWYHTATVAVTGGRYLSSNLKLEGELTLSREGSQYGLRLEQFQGVGPYAVGAERLTRTSSASLAAVWQFYENQWVHPFVMAGAALDFDRQRVHIWQQSYFRSDPRSSGYEVLVPEERIEDLGTDRVVRALVGAGAKFYVSPRAFFRTDSRVALGGRSSGHVSFRLGFGVDF